MKILKPLLGGIGIGISIVIILNAIFWCGYLCGINADKDIHHKCHLNHWGYGEEKSFLTKPDADNYSSNVTITWYSTAFGRK